MQGWSFSEADLDMLTVFETLDIPAPDSTCYPHASRWYHHIEALAKAYAPPAPAPPAVLPETKHKIRQETDWSTLQEDSKEGEHKEDEENADRLLERLTKEAQERRVEKESKQKTLVAIEIKPWDVEQDLQSLWRKITHTVTQPGLKWGESCTMVDIGYGIKKIQCTFVMGVNNSSEDIVEDILSTMENDVQSVEITSMNVL